MNDGATRAKPTHAVALYRHNDVWSRHTRIYARLMHDDELPGPPLK